VVGDRIGAGVQRLMDTGVLATAIEFARARRPFVLATVVGRRPPSSGRLGSKAIILADGSMQGWLGGACAEPTVVREALAALEEGRPRLLFLGSSEELGTAERDGILRVPMACDNEGALEVYVEPFLPEPQLVLIGRSPAVHALTIQARAVGWDVAVVDDGGRPEDHPFPELVRTKLDLSDLGISPSTAIVIATQGHYDDQAMRAALSTNAGYVGVVAAEKRAASLRTRLAEDRFDEAQIARVHAPAGLDLGAVEHIEISVALLADLVARRAAGQLRDDVTAGPPRRETIDPVCGMAVFVDDARFHATHGGADYWFCGEGCRRAFDHDPAAFVS
jgi:xanthine dehydrogenase accessory factor